MKFLCFSDLHRDREAARSLVSRSPQADFVIGAGDFANRHEGLADTIDVLSEITVPSILVPGNGETFEELLQATQNWPSAHVLHGSGVETDGLHFWGVGGGIPITPFGSWSYDFDEQQGSDLLQACPKSGVLVVHSPPLGIVDEDGAGKVRGSEAILACVESKSPRLVVCGHIHSSWEKQARQGDSLILNAGPRGVLVECEFS